MTQSHDQDPGHEAACSCGQLRVRLAGDPYLVSSCHCLACQRRTGAVFGSNGFFKKSQVRSTEGEHKSFRRQGETGNWLDFHFCPACGSTVFWLPESKTDTICIAVGTLADPAFPALSRTVWVEKKHAWLTFPASIAHHDQNPR